MRKRVSKQRRPLRLESLEGRRLLASLAINDDAGLTNSRSVQVHVSELPQDAERIRFRFNGSSFGQWRAFSESTTLNLPNWQGTNWIQAQVALEDGNSVWPYDSIEYARPKLIIQNGEQTTNTRSVQASFERVADDAVAVRFKNNGGSYGAWSPYTATSQVVLPSYRGTNWVQGEIRFADGSSAVAYDSIQYARPTLQINQGAVATNTRVVSADFGAVAPSVVDVRMKVNGATYGKWQAYADSVNVVLPNYEGTNWVQSQFRFADGSTATAYDSIRYQRPRLQLSEGAEVTNARVVTADLDGIASGAQQMRFKVNGSNYSAWQPFTQGAPIELPNYEGVNWVQTEIRYASGSTATVYDSIDYFKPILVHGSGGITFQLNVQDSHGEGFRDRALGKARRDAAVRAIGIWGDHLSAAYPKETIAIDATMDSLVADEEQDRGVPEDERSVILGGARPADFKLLNGRFGTSVYPIAIANHLLKRDLNGNQPEVMMQLNSDLDLAGNPGWGYTGDAGAAHQHDFTTTVLHEVAHGLGFYSIVQQSGSWAIPWPSIYDRFIVDRSGATLSSMTASERSKAIVESNIFWNGKYGVERNDGARPALEAPAKFSAGSSVSHLSETHHEFELMSPYYSQQDWNPSPIELGMLKDMGWGIAIEIGADQHTFPRSS